MSEFQPLDPSDKLTDIEPVARELCEWIYECTDSDNSVAVLLDTKSMAVTESKGHISASELHEELPDLTPAETEELEFVYTRGEESRAKIQTVTLIGFLEQTLYTAEVKRRTERGMSEEDIHEELNSIQFPIPGEAISRTIIYPHPKDGSELTFIYTDLHNRDDNVAIASSYQIQISDGQVRKTYAFLYYENELSMAYVRSDLEEDDLRGRARKLLNLEDYAEATNIISGVLPLTEEELDERLSNIWLKYRGTSREIEIGPLLDEVRVRYFGAHDALKLGLMLGNHGIPSLQELIKLKDYFSS